MARGAQQDAETTVGAAIALCKELFTQYDELWLIGHKGDHHVGLVDMGVLPNRQAVALTHVHSSLGLHTRQILKPPIGSSASLGTIITGINPGLKKHIEHVLSAGAKVCVLQPFPNEGFTSIVSELHAEQAFMATPPVALAQTYWEIEDKLRLAIYLEEYAQKAAFAELRPVIVPWSSTRELGLDFEQYRKHFQLKDGQGICLQEAVSAGGSGTTIVHSQAEIDALCRKSRWRRLADAGRIKITPEVIHAYPANGSACIVPLSQTDCMVLVDPLSHKPVGPGYSSLGNDWTKPWPASLQAQYVRATVLLGRMLYQAFGYTGLFGPDFIVAAGDGELSLKLTEINPRWQGTTPYQTKNALFARRIPLEVMHYIVKLDRTDGHIQKLIELIGDPDTYNTHSAAQHGVFYLKIMSRPGQQVLRDTNGHYRYANGKLQKVSARQGSLMENICTIKAPKKGELLGKNLAPIGYVWGLSDRPVASMDPRNLTPYGTHLYNAAIQEIFGETLPGQIHPLQ